MSAPGLLGAGAALLVLAVALLGDSTISGGGVPGCQFPTENSPTPIASAPIGAIRPAPTLATTRPASGDISAIATNPLASTIPARGRLSPVWRTRK